MRAPVYRDVEVRETILGLAFPSEALVVLGFTYLPLAVLDSALGSLAALVASYIGIRALTYGRPPQYLQHLVAFHVRRLSGGRISAANRARHKAFPVTAIPPWVHLHSRVQTSARRSPPDEPR
ncbi:hypothetical protein [Corallococcus terminator]|uniref:Uncharacterized protein n=1 Tax=Corallococcus terminator TaxID=2316733 RepID=A0A3A8HNN2_9BACT|nr:hypothetical protein [Corallococcus terminator]RKG67471.1 hypothetical protein D7V88_41080 [Corallococcus terminator]